MIEKSLHILTVKDTFPFVQMAAISLRLPEIIVKSNSLNKIPFHRMMSGSASIGTPGEGAGKGGGTGGKS